MFNDQITEQYYYEIMLIEIGRRYVEQGVEDPQAKAVSDLLFDFAHLVTDACTEAGKAIKSFVEVKEQTNFSLACNDEYEAMQVAISSYGQRRGLTPLQADAATAGTADQLALPAAQLKHGS